MTPAQLEELEKLAEAAPLGEWPEDELWAGDEGFCAQGPYHDCPHGGHKNARDVDTCNEVLSAAALADQVFLREMSKQALPLIKALQEAHRVIAMVLDTDALAQWACERNPEFDMEGDTIENICRRTLGREVYR